MLCRNCRARLGVTTEADLLFKRLAGGVYQKTCPYCGAKTRHYYPGIEKKGKR